LDKPKWIKDFGLNDVYKGYWLDLDKVVDPTKTIELAKERLKRFGNRILRGTIRIDSNRLKIPVYFSLCGVEAEEVIGTKKQMGKGGSVKQAEASALMELVERYSLFSFVKSPNNFLPATYNELKGAGATLLPIQEIQKAVGDEDPPGIVIETFKDIPLRWTWAFDLCDQNGLLVPFDWFWMINEYNGSSSGNVKEEAILQGICEVVERHVSAVISKHKIRVPRIKTEMVEDESARDLLTKFANLGVKLYLSDFSLNTGIPTVGALAYDPNTFPHRSEIVWTAGTTTSPQKSLIRALTEVAQLAGDFDTAVKYVPSGLPKPRSLEEVDFIIYPGDSHDLSNLPDISHPNLKVEIERAISNLMKIGFKVLIIDITKDELSIPAFYTIVPGAQFRERAHGKMGLFVVRILYETFSKEQALLKYKAIEPFLSKEPYIYFYEAEALRSLNRQKEALNLYDKAFELSENNFDKVITLTYKALAQKDLGFYEDAIESLNLAISLDSDNYELFSLLGNCYYKANRFEDAICQFTKALEINPGSAIDYANIATNYLKLGKKKDAMEYYNIALKIDPNLKYARERVGELMAWERDPQLK